jgi:hypothetical protein
VITEFLIGVGTSVGSWFASLWPSWTPPAFLTDLSTTVNGLLANLNGVGAWADWGFIFGVVAAVLLVWVFSAAVKLIRAVASYLPFIGGAG